MSASPSRRRLLQAALLAPVAAACTSRRSALPALPVPIDPDIAIRAAAVARERTLIERYRAAATSSVSGVAKTAALAAEHEQHLAALGAGSPSPSPSSSAAAAAAAVPTLLQLAAAERAAAAAHAAAALHSSRHLAAVLASLAASEASHAVVLT